MVSSRLGFGTGLSPNKANIKAKKEFNKFTLKAQNIKAQISLFEKIQCKIQTNQPVLPKIEKYIQL